MTTYLTQTSKDLPVAEALECRILEDPYFSSNACLTLTSSSAGDVTSLFDDCDEVRAQNSLKLHSVTYSGCEKFTCILTITTKVENR